MRYISLCSGIEAASVAWQPLGWEAVAFSEIEPFPCAVLAHHYPDVPNLGDMTKVHDWRPYSGAVDLVVGGTPCQDFSVAGKRAGLAGERSALALEFIRLLQEVEPDYFIWENVPGCLSTNKGNDFKLLLEAFQEAGYILDADILDAQFFGVPQRRRRVFVCGIRLDSLPKKKTISSSAIIAKCLLSILQNILEDKFSLLEKGLVNSEFNANLNDGLRKKISFLFKLGKNTEDWTSLLRTLDVGFQKLLIEQKNSAVILGGINQQELQEGLWLNLLTEPQCLLTEESWKKSLDDLSLLRKSFTISTETKTTTQEIICACSRIVLNIGKLIILMKSFYPNLSVVDISDLTAIKEYTKYARWTNSSLLGGDGRHSTYWNDFIRQAEYLNHVVGHLGDWRPAAAVLFEPNRLRGDTAARRTARAHVTQALTGRLGGGGPDDNKAQGGFYIPDIVPQAMSCKWSKGTSGPAGDEYHNLIAIQLNKESGDTFHASPQKTHAGALLRILRQEAGEEAFFKWGLGMLAALQQKKVLQSFLHGKSLRQSASEAGLQMDDSTLSCKEDLPSKSMQDLWKNGPDGRTPQGRELAQQLAREFNQTLQRSPHSDSQRQLAVRRLTPTEAERLQGFPDNYTLIPYRGKAAADCADGPRYKALGNSMCVPVMRWIGRRIARVSGVEDAELFGKSE